MKIASKSQAENGVDNETIMTPLRVKQSIKANSSGGGGGTSDYNDLDNKPRINGVELSGNKSGSDLGLTGGGDMLKSVYDINNNGVVDNSEKVNNHTVLSDVPANAVFTDTVYDDTAITALANSKYTKPSGGIPKTDLASAVQASLGKADSAIQSSDLATVATSGDYSDLSNTPTIPTVNNATLTIKKNNTSVGTFTANSSTDTTVDITVPTKTSDITNDSSYVSDSSYVHTDNNYTTTEKTKLSGIAAGAEVNVQSNWNESDTTSDSYIQNKPTIPTVPTNISAFTNDIGYLTSESDPVFSGSAASTITSSDISSWTAKQDALVSGTNIKTINNTSLLGSGNITIGGGTSDYQNLTNKPSINSIELSGNKTAAQLGFSTVATSGSYSDLSNKPTIPTVNNATLTIQKNGTTIDTFTANSSTDTTVNVTVPTKTSDLTNDSGYITGYTETDPIFSASVASGISSSDISNWNGKAEVSDIPTKTSDLTNDGEGYLGNVYAVTRDDGNGIFTQSDGQGGYIVKPILYNSVVNYPLAAKSDIPTNVSDLTNDAGYIDSSYHDSSKQDTLVSGTNIKTINNESLLGSGNITISGGGTKNILKASLTSDYTISSTGEKKLTLATNNYQDGSALSISNGGIKIGAGITKVKVSGSVYFSASTNAGDSLRAVIKQNSDTVGISFARAGTNGTYETRSIVPVPITVQENDIIYLYCNNATAGQGKVASGSYNTYLIVEEI